MMGGWASGYIIIGTILNTILQSELMCFSFLCSDSNEESYLKLKI